MCTATATTANLSATSVASTVALGGTAVGAPGQPIAPARRRRCMWAVFRIVVAVVVAMMGGCERTAAAGVVLLRMMCLFVRQSPIFASGLLLLSLVELPRRVDSGVEAAVDHCASNVVHARTAGRVLMVTPGWGREKTKKRRKERNGDNAAGSVQNTHPKHTHTHNANTGAHTKQSTKP